MTKDATTTDADTRIPIMKVLLVNHEHLTGRTREILRAVANGMEWNPDDWDADAFGPEPEELPTLDVEPQGGRDYDGVDANAPLLIRVVRPQSDTPDDLRGVFAYAVKNDCHHLMLQYGGRLCPGLRTYAE